MLQYPVPQFTEVEDKIIGPLTLKQFGIVFGAGIFVFLIYSATKSLIVLIVLCILIGLPALMVAFAKPNGRPLYNSFGAFFRFFTGARFLVFHKESTYISRDTKISTVSLNEQKVNAPVKSQEDTKTRIKKINALLEQQQTEETEALKFK